MSTCNPSGESTNIGSREGPYQADRSFRVANSCKCLTFPREKSACYNGDPNDLLHQRILQVEQTRIETCQHP